MPPRLYFPDALHAGVLLTLPEGPSRHLQVLRMQPGQTLRLFNGHGGEWSAEVLRMGRREVEVRIGVHDPVEREAACGVTLAFGMPANDRMDALLEKATELGVAAVQPLVCEHSVLRLAGARAEKKLAHWQAVVAAASEQCGRTRLPRIEPVRGLVDWLQSLPAPTASASAGTWRGVLSLRQARPLAQWLPSGAQPTRAVFLSGPEGGLSPAEEAAAQAAGFTPLSLGQRILRADTAPLAALAWVILSGG